MHFSTTAALSALLSVSIIPLAFSEVSSAAPENAKLPAFFLAGDSTTAAQASAGGGWGTGFLSFVKQPAWGQNYAQSGATTVSFVSGNDSGRDHVISSVKQNAAKYNCFVTIQFGHNDQDPSKNISLHEYQNNLRDLALNVTDAGGIPILVSPLSRRNLTSEHVVKDDLHEQRLATIAAANAAKAHFIDLNKASREYVSAIGNKAAVGYSLKKNDETHLTNWGSIVFGRIVADLLLGHKPHVKPSSVNGSRSARSDGSEVVSGIRPWISQNETLSHKVWNGLPA